MSSVPEISVQNLDHLGLVAGLIDEIGIVEQINQLVGEKPGEIVSPGHAVKAMILNGLGLVSAPLYLFSQFFKGKATEHFKYHKLTQIQPVPVLSEFEPNSCFRAESYQQAYKIQAQLEPDTDAIALPDSSSGTIHTGDQCARY
jgi:transposase